MAFVDLNSSWAKIAKTRETSDYTSIQERLGISPCAAQYNDKKQLTEGQNVNKLALSPLLAFAGNEHEDDSSINNKIFYAMYRRWKIFVKIQVLTFSSSLIKIKKLI